MKPVFSMKLNLIKVLFFLLLILPSTFGFSPNFSTTTEHYFSEKIDLGIEGNYPLDTNYMNITIIGKDTNFVYFSQDLNLSEKDYFPFVFSTLSEDDLFYVIYSFISSDNKIINSKSFDLFLFRLPFSLNYFFCTDINCSEQKNYFFESDNIYLISPPNNKIDFYNIKIFKDNTLIQDISNTQIPIKINLQKGHYTFEIDSFFKNKKFSKTIYLDIVENGYVPKDIFSEKPDFIRYLEGVEKETKDPDEISKSKTISKEGEIEDNTKPKISFLYFILGAFIVLIIILIVFKKKQRPKEKYFIPKENVPKERKKEIPRRLRKRLVSCFVVIFIVVFVFIFLNKSYLLQAQDLNDIPLEKSYLELKDLFSYPKIINVNVTPSKLSNTTTEPLITNDIIIEPFIQAPSIVEGSFEVSPLDVYLLVNINSERFDKFLDKYLPQGYPKTDDAKRYTDIISFYYQNPIESKLELIQRTKENLCKRFDKEDIDFLIHEQVLIPKQYLIEVTFNAYNFPRDQSIKTKIDFKPQFMQEVKPIDLSLNYIKDGLIAYMSTQENEGAVRIIAQEKGWDPKQIDTKKFKELNKVFTFDNIDFLNIDNFDLLERKAGISFGFYKIYDIILAPNTNYFFHIAKNKNFKSLEYVIGSNVVNGYINLATYKINSYSDVLYKNISLNLKNKNKIKIQFDKKNKEEKIEYELYLKDISENGEYEIIISTENTTKTYYHKPGTPNTYFFTNPLTDQIAFFDVNLVLLPGKDLELDIKGYHIFSYEKEEYSFNVENEHVLLKKFDEESKDSLGKIYFKQEQKDIDILNTNIFLLDVNNYFLESHRFVYDSFIGITHKGYIISVYEFVNSYENINVNSYDMNLYLLEGSKVVGDDQYTSILEDKVYELQMLNEERKIIDNKYKKLSIELYKKRHLETIEQKLHNIFLGISEVENEKNTDISVSNINISNLDKLNMEISILENNSSDLLNEYNRLSENISSLESEINKILNGSNNLLIEFLKYDNLNNKLLFKINNNFFEYDIFSKNFYTPGIKKDILKNLQLNNFNLSDFYFNIDILATKTKHISGDIKYNKLDAFQIENYSLVNDDFYGIDYLSNNKKYCLFLNSEKTKLIFDETNPSEDKKEDKNNDFLYYDEIKYPIYKKKIVFDKFSDNHFTSYFNLLDCNFNIKDKDYILSFKLDNKDYNINFNYKHPENNFIVIGPKKYYFVLENSKKYLQDIKILNVYIVDKGSEISFSKIEKDWTISTDEKNQVITKYLIINDEYLIYNRAVEKYSSSDSQLFISYLNLPEFEYSCNIKKLEPKESDLKVKIGDKINIDNYSFSFDKDDFVLSNMSSNDSVLPSKISYDILADFNGVKKIIAINPIEPYYFLLNKNYIIRVDNNFFKKAYFELNVDMPENLNYYLKNKHDMYAFKNIRSQIINEINYKFNNENKKYDYFLIIGNKYDFHELSDLGKNKLGSFFVLDNCYVNDCPDLELENNLAYENNFLVGRLPFSNKNQIFNYYKNLPFTASGKKSNIIFPDNRVIVAERTLYSLTNLNFIPNIKLYNYNSSFFEQMNSSNITPTDENTYFIVNPDNSEYFKAFNESTQIYFDTHGAPRFFLIKDNKFYDLHLKIIDFFKNRPGIIANSCNTGMSLGETALGLGARFYFGSVYPLLNYSSLLPVSYTYNSIGYFSNANMNYYQYITNNLQGNLGISDYSSRDFPYILFGDPSLILQNYSSYKSPNMYVNSKEMFLNFSNININYGFINLDNLVHEHDIDKIYKKNNGFIFEKDNFFQISENDKEKLVNYHKFFNYFKRIFSPEEYLFSVVSNNTIFNIALKDKWKAYKISYIKNRFYLTLDMDTPLFYDIENPDFLENFNSWFDKNASIFANVFIDDKPILSKEIILKIDKNTDNKFLYFDLTWEDFLDMIKNGVLDNPYRIVISEQKYKLK